MDGPRVLDQLEGHWKKLLTFVLWKLNGRNALVISHDDLEKFRRLAETEGMVLFTHGFSDRIELSVVDHEAVSQLSAGKNIDFREA